MTFPDTIKCKWIKNLFDIEEMRVSRHDDGETYYHGRVVEELKRQVEERRNWQVQGVTINAIQSLYDEAIRQREELQAKLDKAKESLKFYADEASQVADAIIDVMPDSRGEPMEYIKDFDSPYNLDKGQRARTTLEEIE